MGGRLLGRPEETLVIPSFASLAQLKRSAQPPLGSAPASAEAPEEIPPGVNGPAVAGDAPTPDADGDAPEPNDRDRSTAAAASYTGAALEAFASAMEAQPNEDATDLNAPLAQLSSIADEPTAGAQVEDVAAEAAAALAAAASTPAELVTPANEAIRSAPTAEAPLESSDAHWADAGHDEVIAALLDNITAAEGEAEPGDEPAVALPALVVEAVVATESVVAVEAAPESSALGESAVSEAEPAAGAGAEAGAEAGLRAGLRAGVEDGARSETGDPAAAEPVAEVTAQATPEEPAEEIAEQSAQEGAEGIAEFVPVEPGKAAIVPEAAVTGVVAPVVSAAEGVDADSGGPVAGVEDAFALEPPAQAEDEAAILVAWPTADAGNAIDAGASPASATTEGRPVLALGEAIEFEAERLLTPLPLWSAVVAVVALLALVGAGAALLVRSTTVAPSQSTAQVEVAEEIAATPTGLASALAVVNPNNVTPAPVVADASGATGRTAPAAPAGRTVLTQTAAVPLSVPGGLNWPYALEIITPTPDSEEERLLFSEPLVAAEIEEVVAIADTGAAPVEQPVILPAMIAEANGGHAMAAPSLDDLIGPRILPAIEVVQFPDEATPTPFAEPVPTEAPIVLAPGRPWSTYAPAGDATHFWVGRPHPASVANQIAAPSYQYGSTGGGRYRPHHGMDIANTFGTPVRAATTGEVVHACLDDLDILGPYSNFYGNAVVIRLDRRLAVAGGEMDVYLLYGHMSEVNVTKGQRVQPDDIVGKVGMSGIAIGPHLHVEMRVGANNYESSVNSYLWVEPPAGDGAVAVRLVTADGRTWPRARVTLARFEGNVATWARVMEIYPDDESINPDPSFGENGAMEAVPAGNYLLVTQVNGERVAAEAVVEPGKTTYVEMRTQQ